MELHDKATETAIRKALTYDATVKTSREPARASDPFHELFYSLRID